MGRMKKKVPELSPEDPEVEQQFRKEYTELDYIEWLKSFDQFHDIPRYCKFKEKSYADYLDGVIAYLRGLLLRTQPMVGVEKLEQQFDKEFEERWSDRSIPGWQEPTHKKKVDEMQKMSFEDQKKLIEAVDEEDKRIAR